MTTDIDDLLSPASVNPSNLILDAETRRASVRTSLVTLDETRYSIVELNGEEEGSSTPRPKARDDTSGSIDDCEPTNLGNPAEHNTPNTVAAESPPDSADPNVPTSTLLGHDRTLSKEGQEVLQNRFERIQLAEKQESAEENDIDWDFWGAVMANYPQFASERGEELARAIEKGIPHTLRGMMWQLMSASKDPELEASYAAHIKENSPHEKAILRDLGRTFPHHEYFMDGTGVGQENLLNVLKAYSLHDTVVGYCQGLPFVVAILLLNMPDEEAFCLLVRLMQSYGLEGHFLPEMPGLQLRLFQFDRLLEELLPALHLHFLRQGVKSSMYASQWFLTVFSYRFPLEITFRVFDNCLANGIEAMFRFGLVLLVKNEDLMLTLKFDEILSFLKNHLLDRYRMSSKDSTTSAHDHFRVDELVSDAFQIQITPFMLDNFAHEWAEVVRIRDAHATEMDNLRTSNRALALQIKALEESLSKLNEDHCEIAKQLVMSRLENEELESELVRYKLLYADAMHDNEAGHTSSLRLSSQHYARPQSS